MRGGENISCTQVESGIYNHPGIIHCVAVSIPCKRLGERVGIVCIPRDDVKQWPSEKEILAEAVKVLPRVSQPFHVKLVFLTILTLLVCGTRSMLRNHHEVRWLTIF